MDLPDIFDSSSDDDDLREMLAAQLGKTVDQLPSCRRDGTARRAQPSSPPASFNVNGRHAESSSNPRPTSGYGSTTIWVDGMPVRQTDPRQIQATRPRNGFNSTQANSNNNASYDYQSRLYDEPAEYNRERHNSHNDTQYDERLDRLNGENRAPIYNNNIYNAQQDISFVRRDQPRSPIIRSNQYGSSSQDEDDNQQSNNEATIRNNVRSPPAPNNQTRRIARVSTVFRQMHQERQINDSDEHGKQIDNQPPEISFDMIDRYRQQLNQEEERRFSRRSEHNTDRRNGRNSYSSRPEQSAYSPPSTRTTVRMPRCLLISLRGVPEQANLQDIVKVFSEFGNLYSARLDLKTNTGGHTSASRHTGRGAICYMPISPNPHTIIRKLIERTEALSISICNSSVWVNAMSDQEIDEHRRIDEECASREVLLPRFLTQPPQEQLPNNQRQEGSGIGWQRFTADSLELGSEPRRGVYLSCWEPDGSVRMAIDPNKGRVQLEFTFDGIDFRMELRCKDAPCWFRIQRNDQTIRNMRDDADPPQSVTLLLKLTRPPLVERLEKRVESTSTNKEGTYNRDNAWQRVVHIRMQPVPQSSKTEPFEVLPHDEDRGLVLFGSWLDYRLQFNFGSNRRSDGQTFLNTLKNAQIFGLRHLADNEDARMNPLQGIPATVKNNDKTTTDTAMSRNGTRAEETLSFYTQLDLNVTYDPFEYPWKKISQSKLATLGAKSFPVQYRLQQYITQRRLSEHAIDEEFLNLLANNVDNGVAEHALRNLVHRMRDTDNINELLEREISRLKSDEDPYNADDDEYEADTPTDTWIEGAGRIISEHTNRTALPDYCVAIPKVVVTPTKMYVLEPMVETSNRVVRSFAQHADRLLRIQFLDESLFGIRGAEKTHDMLFRRLFSILVRGILVGGRHYEFLAFSSSQLREYGCWFIASKQGDNGITADQIREWMGDFSDYKIIGKLAARMGQCFSSTRMTIELEPKELKRIPDIITTDGAYTFSDGVGRMSLAIARAVEEKMGLKELPSAVQFRLGGCKGVLSLHPPLSSTLRRIEYRDSQCKFKSDHRALEVIRVANYTAGALNRQIIVLLTCLGVDGNVILNRMTEMMDRINRAMNERETAIRLLQQSGDEYETVNRMVAMLRAGLLDKHETYLANLLRVFRACQLRELKRKAKIPIEQSVMLLGVMDEFNILEPHEIFLQYDHPAYEKPYVPTGPCAVTRNPCFHPGDIRLLTAVDKPELRHLKNVIVFSQKGDRDVPSQCSGGDLDGDEFTCIWDPKLLPEADFKPMDNTPPTSPTKENIDIRDIKRFFVNYILYDNLGMIAHAHLAQADQLTNGARHGTCIRLAQLHSIAVDFPKTGVPAEFERALRPRSYPHFMEKSDKPMYHSETVLGKIYDAITLEEFKPDDNAQIDERMLANGYEIFLKEARILKHDYDQAIDGVMKQFGIATEWEAISGWVIQFQDAFQRRDYHLRQQVMELVSGIEARFKRNFMEEFKEAVATEADPLESAIIDAKPANNGGAVNVRLEDLMARSSINTATTAAATSSSVSKKAPFPEHIQEAIRSKASAWYYVTYEPSERALAGEYGDRLSFPWLVYEHLCELIHKRQQEIDDRELAHILA